MRAEVLPRIQPHHGVREVGEISGPKPRAGRASTPGGGHWDRKSQWTACRSTILIGPEYTLPDDECGVPHAGGWFGKRLLAAEKVGAKARMWLATMAGAGDDGVRVCDAADVSPIRNRSTDAGGSVTPNPTALTGFVKSGRFPDPNPGPDGRVRPAADIGTGNRRGQRSGVPSLNRAGVPVAR
jgi:hypothetical protein